MYNSMYNRLESTGIGTKGKSVVEALLALEYPDSNSVSQNDALMFGNVLSDIFNMITPLSTNWPFYDKTSKTPIRCFQFPQLSKFDFINMPIFNPSNNYVTFGQFYDTLTEKTFTEDKTKMILIQFIQHLPGHYVFYRRLNGAYKDEWLKYNDTNVSYHENLDISKMKIVLSCFLKTSANFD